MSSLENIDKWRVAVKSLIDCMSEEQLEKNFNSLLNQTIYSLFRREKSKNSFYKFGQHIWNNLEIGGIVSCPELFYEEDEEIVKDFIACFLFEAGLKLNKG